MSLRELVRTNSAAEPVLTALVLRKRLHSFVDLRRFKRWMASFGYIPDPVKYRQVFHSLESLGYGKLVRTPAGLRFFATKNLKDMAYTALAKDTIIKKKPVYLVKPQAQEEETVDIKIPKDIWPTLQKLFQAV